MFGNQWICYYRGLKIKGQWKSDFWRKCSFVAFLIHFSFIGNAQILHITEEKPTAILSNYMEQWIDPTHMATVDEVLTSVPFTRSNGSIPVFPNDVTDVWFRFTVNNQSLSQNLFLNIDYSNLSSVSLYAIDSGKAVFLGHDGNEVIPTAVYHHSPHLIFDLLAAPGSSHSFLLRIHSRHPIIFPASIATYDELNQALGFQTLVSGVFFGVMMVMFLYNLFLYTATKDKNYLYYIIYIFFVTLAQSTIAGYEFRYFWPAYPAVNKYAVIVSSTLSALAGLIFTMHFLQTAIFTKKIHAWLRFLVFIYIAGLVICVFSTNLRLNYEILNYNGLIGVISVLIASFYIAKKHFRPAYFYLIAWLFFLISFIILILRNIAILPYNDITTYSIYVGASFEVALLSIALADKINVLRREKEQSQAESLQTLQENEKLIRDQNTMLEKNVAERTEELMASNLHLSEALKDLKDAQIQLVEAEKMASLGQLTAGIAHEINNPINFVKSNIGPLQLDIGDLVAIIDAYEVLHQSDAEAVPAQLAKIEQLKKQVDLAYLKDEISNLVKGIRDGAERTVEIVKGLRTFSRLDEGEIKIVNIYEGLESTLVLLRNSIPTNISVEMDLAANGNVECYPGKLNQVFMNILSNAIQAVKKKKNQSETEYIKISSKDLGTQIEIRIKDTGMGMPDEVRTKIFDPFFTTKEVGEGTGLGLSIVYKIIHMHFGKIEVVSAEGKGAEFIITLNYTLPRQTTG